MSFDDLSRLTDRSRTKMIERFLKTGQLPRATERAMRREGGVTPGSLPDVEIVGRDAAVRLAGTEDMRSELVRRLVQMEVIESTKALARSDVEVEAGGDDDGGESGSAPPTAMAGIFEQWFTEMQGQGLNKAEIEEHLISRIRAVRRGIHGAGEERRLRRK